MNILKRDGSSEPLDFSKIERLNEFATRGLNVDLALLKSQIKLLIYEGMTTRDIFKAQIGGAAGLISVKNPDFTFVAARYLLADTIKEAVGKAEYPHLKWTVAKGIAEERYQKSLQTTFDLGQLDNAIDKDRDLQFDYYGLQNLVDRYLMRDAGQKLFELPQHFFMRVAMGLALNEQDPTARAIEFYELLSSFDFMSSTPTLFNSGTRHSQLSSCYLNTVTDQISSEPDLGEHRFASIYGTIEECARLSKFAGGIGTDWNRVRGAGSRIESTNGKSSGVIPYLKPYNDTAVAVNQGGKRKGSFAPYLSPWHPDFMDYCELKKEFGDDRLRAHDIFPAAWIPDVFMERVQAARDIPGLMWSFFQPHLHPELNELHGGAFTTHYEALEDAGEFQSQRPVLEVWRHILTNLFETGHPWVTFKDECNRRSPQDHVGIVRSSNLCTEITLNTSDTETAVCNLGSINLSKHVENGQIMEGKIASTVTTAMRMLDNVIDLNYYPSDRARNSNLKHRPVGLGIMGETEAKIACGISFDSQAGVEFSDRVMELVSFYAIKASSKLAQERGRYESYQGSKWSRGILPIDTARSRETYLGEDTWQMLRETVMTYGMRNSNCMAIAPTATISTLVYTTPCNEPIFEIERDESNMSGSFKVVDPCVFYGRPDLMVTAFNIAPYWYIETAARRQKWIDQSQSLNIFAPAGTTGRELANIYMLAWEKGLKTTYYLRSQSATKETAKVSSDVKAALEKQADLDKVVMSPGFCAIENPNCTSCE